VGQSWSVLSYDLAVAAEEGGKEEGLDSQVSRLATTEAVLDAALAALILRTRFEIV
jgi:hypothetical protein